MIGLCKSVMPRAVIALLVFVVMATYIVRAEEKSPAKAEAAKPFVLKKEKILFGKLLEQVEAHFGRPTICQKPAEEYLGDMEGPIDLKASNYFECICEISRQSGFGFTPFIKGGAVFDADNYPVIQWMRMRNGVFYVLAPVYLEPLGDGKPTDSGIVLCFWSDEGAYGQIDYMAMQLATKDAKHKFDQPLGSSGRMNMFENYFMPPETFAVSDVAFTGEVLLQERSNPFSISLPLCESAESKKDDVSLVINKIKLDDGDCVVECHLGWECGLNPEEKKKSAAIAQRIIGSKFTQKLTPEENRWQASVSTKAKGLNVAECTVVKQDGTKHASKSQFWVSNPAVGNDGKIRFALKAIPENARLELQINECRWYKEKFSFPHLDLKVEYEEETAAETEAKPEPKKENVTE